MKKHHHFIGNFELEAERLLIRDNETIHRIKTVLKLKVGESIVLSNGQGQEALVKIAGIDKSGIETVLQERRASPEPEKQIILYCALLKRENFEYAVEKAVEGGVYKIVPIISARTVKLGMNLDRLKSIAKEAAEQCGRGIVPEVLEPIKFSTAIKKAGENDVNYFFDASGEEFVRSKSLAKTVGVWIGPEGGWEDFEIELAHNNHLLNASLGKLILRAETAVTIAVYIASR